jgi:hypothetical protein
MAYARSAHEFRDLTARDLTVDVAARRGFFRRVFDAIVEGRRRNAEREIEAFLQGRGKYLTDDTEREITRILTSSTHL